MINTTAFLLRQTARAAVREAADYARACVPDDRLVATRLASLPLTDMRWLSQDVDLTPPDGGPDLRGAMRYPAPD